MSGPIEAAIRFMDSHSGAATDQGALEEWGPHPHHWRLSQALELYSSKAVEAGLWTESQGREKMAWRRVSGNPAIRQKAGKEDAEIHWGDETGLCNDSYHGGSYAPRGKTPAIRLSARYKRVNLISTVTNQGKVRFMIYKDRMNADTFIKFMKRLIKDADRKVLLIIDNLKVHHGYKARNWLQEHTDHIEVFFLPSYSPELNPDEYLNCDLKAGVHSGPPARSREQLKSKALSHLRKLQKMPKRVMKYFKHTKIAYASCSSI